jgi:predicted transcriptional regulator
MAKHNATSRIVRDTSVVVFGRVDVDTLAGRKRRILDYIKRVHGATCWEVEQALGFPHETAHSLIRQLYLKGQLVDKGERRPTSSGWPERVWVVVP